MVLRMTSELPISAGAQSVSSATGQESNHLQRVAPRSVSISRKKKRSDSKRALLRTSTRTTEQNRKIQGGCPWASVGTAGIGPALWQMLRCRYGSMRRSFFEMSLHVNGCKGMIDAGTQCSEYFDVGSPMMHGHDLDFPLCPSASVCVEVLEQ